MNNVIDLLKFNYNDEHISGLNYELKSLFLLGLFSKEKRPILVVTNTLYEANLLYKSLNKHVSRCYLFPMDDFLTSVAIAASPELKTNRLETLNELISDDVAIVVTNLMGYLRMLPKKEEYKESILTISLGQQISLDELSKKLFDMGYRREALTNTTGDMSIRGYVIDIFPVGFNDPVRIEFWGDDIENIKSFNIDTQLTLEKLDKITIKPNTEVNEVVNNVNAANITSYMNNCLVFFNNINEINAGYDILKEQILDYCISKEIPTDTKFMFDIDEIKYKDAKYFDEFGNSEYMCQDIEPFVGGNTKERLSDYLKKNKLVIICVNNRYQANKIQELDDKYIFTDIDNLVENKVNIIIKNIETGFVYNDIVVISEKEIFNKVDKANVYHSKFKIGTKIRDITKLNIGDYVVHQNHGIGRYLGLTVLTKNGLKKDYLMLEYRGGDKLYIPVEKIDTITKYSSNESLVPKLNKLGGVEWSKTKMQVKAKTASIAKDLLKLYAEREKKIGFSFQKDGEEQLMFEKEFIYTPTIDQIRVTEEVKKDMESIHPMDRLICGDVGFGKTEVAFRAIFKAIMSGKQTAILCPTTILSEQHYQNAIERFSSFDVNIAILNRFVTASKVKRTLEDLKKGKIDLIIGTHRLLSDDVEFKNLGLLVIDEEQRFGVKHKEIIKQIKTNVDVLTLSATPIPRTLQMSLVGIRSLSLIETPPINRYPVQTYVIEENNQLIKDAIYKELSRGGQAFLLYNKVQSMDEEVNKLKKLVPDARVVSAHGQLNKNDLETRIMDFINHKYDVLVCSTIIETGIDIPNVNTLIIKDADRFGLSQLYQIRGRVGRSDKFAYAYLMYNKNKVLTETAIKRLNVIKEFTALGSGFSIATRDLSIRGAGDILGSEQAGFIDSVGIDLYLKLLNDEIERKKGNLLEEETEEVEDKPLLSVNTHIDDNYVSEDDLKIEIHRKINEINSLESLKLVKRELEDRFGKLSEDIIIYMYEEWFENLANKLKIKNVRQTKNSIEMVFTKDVVENLKVDDIFVEAFNITPMFRFISRGSNLVIVLDIIKLEKHPVYYLVSLLDKILNNFMK